MLGHLEVGDAVLGEHVTAQVALRLEGAARRTPHGDLLPGLGDLAGADVPQVGENATLVAVGAHPGMLLHLPLRGEEATAVGTIVLQCLIINETLTYRNVFYLNSYKARGEL